MIYKKPSKITKSLVNTAYEDHYNASKAIKDDAPITDNTSVISSINFNV